MKRVLIFLMLIVSVNIYAANCENRVFSVSADGDGVTAIDLLSQLSNECNFAISIKDAKAKELLNTPMSSFSLVKVPFYELLNIIIKEKDLSYDYTGNLLKISYFQTKTFRLNYISSSRTSKSSTGVTISGNTDAIGSSSSDESGVGENKGKTETTIESADTYYFWSSIENELKAIVLGSNTQPISQATATQSQQNIYTNENGSSIVINSGAGLITVTGTVEEIRKAEEYLKKIKESLHTSVMIDVSILKVTNSDAKSTGIDWDKLLNLQNVNLNYAASGLFNQQGGGDGTVDAVTYPTDTAGGGITSSVKFGGEVAKNFGYSIVSGSISLNRVIDFMKNYGDVTSISNPKVITLNNQPALISVGDIIRYESEIVYQASGTSGTTQNSAKQYPSVFAGILLDITPSIEGDDVILRINPSITGVKGSDVESATTALAAPPNLTTNQLSSLVKVRDGDRIILGGLIKKSNSIEEKKVPLLGDIPLLGYAFKSKKSSAITEEMVIVITPHIIKANQNNEIKLKDLGYQLSSKHLNRDVAELTPEKNATLEVQD